MTDQQSATQADADATSQADTDHTTHQTDDTQAASSPETISLDEAKKLRSEAASLRKRLKEAEGRVQQFEQAAKTDLERLTEERDAYKSRAEQLETQMREARAETAFLDAATKARARSPRTLFRAYRDAVEYGDDGQPTNIDALLAHLQADEPDLFAGPMPGRGDGGKQGPAPDTTDVNALIRAKWRGQQ